MVERISLVKSVISVLPLFIYPSIKLR